MPSRTDLSARLRDIDKDITRTSSEIIDLLERDDPGADTRRANLKRHVVKLQEEAADIHHQLRSEVAEIARSGSVVNGADDYGEANITVGPWSSSARSVLTAGQSTSEVRSRALSAVEKTPGVPDDSRQHFTLELERATGEPLSRLAEWTLATSSPHYLRSFLKLASDPQNGHREFTGPELEAFRHVQTVARAMSLTDAAGGYLVPFQLDPSVILTNSGGTNPIRQLARKVTATSDVWNGVSSAGVVVSWDAEAAEVSDDAPTLASPTIPVWKMQGFVPISIEALEDALNVVQEIGMLLADAADTLEAEALQVGTGIGQPTGIVTALAGTASMVTATGTTLDAPDFRAVQEALGARFQSRAAWVMHLASMNRASIVAGTGLTTPMLDDAASPPRLLGKPVYEASFMDATVTGAASDYLAVYGDWSNYVLADRIGTVVELIPHLFGANRRPVGQRGWYMHRRVGADSVNDAAFRMLDKSA